MNRDQPKKLERDLWSAADKLRANSDLKASEYSTPVLGLIFLKFADNKYRQHEDAILAEYSRLKGTRRERTVQEIAIERCGFALGPFARYDYLLNLPEKEDIAKATRVALAKEGLGARPRPEPIGAVLSHLHDSLQDTVRMAFLPSSRARGRVPLPLKAAAGVRFIGHSAGGDSGTLLRFEVPHFGSAAPELFR